MDDGSLVVPLRDAMVCLIFVLLLLLAGCGAKRDGSGERLSAPILLTPDSHDVVSARRTPLNHTEFFDKQGEVVVGTRGYSRVCGGLAEHGVDGFDAVSWTWELPVTSVLQTRLGLVALTMWVSSGAYGQVEGFLFSPEGKELGRASFSGVGDSNQSMVLKSPLAEGEYVVNLRVCGPERQYRVHAEARYEE